MCYLKNKHKQATKNKIPWDYKIELKKQKMARKTLIENISSS